jgi:luciferase family oxidoreductase group 1
METELLPLSILDLAPIVEGSDAATAFRNSLDLARHAERWGYKRYWLAEHHNMPGIASAATAVVISHVASGTSTIRVGAGGIMLPNHAPLVIAEQFGTLESLYPGRIDLGLGRAPGTDPRTAYALRRNLASNSDTYPQDVLELQAYLGEAQPDQPVRAVPGQGLKVPIWLLGSSLYSAQLAAYLGLPFGFASHFAPDWLLQALDAYRSAFRPSAQLERPYAMVGVNVFAADSDAQARRLMTSAQQQRVYRRRGVIGRLPPPIDDIESFWSPAEKASVEHTLHYSVVGGPDAVERGLNVLVAETGADELMITGQIYDHAARLRSFEIVAGLRARIAATASAPVPS